MLVFINTFGEDRTGMVSELALLLSKFDAEILDIGHAVIHNYLSMGLLVKLPQGLDCLKESVSKLDISVKFTPIDLESYEKWSGPQKRPRQILTLLARKISASHLAEVSSLIEMYGLRIDNILQLSGRVTPLENGVMETKNSIECVEFVLRARLVSP